MCGHGAKGKKHCEALTLVPAAHTPEWSTSGKASSQRLSHSIEPEPLSISVQGVMSGGGVEGLESSLCPTLQQSWSGGKQAMGVGSSFQASSRGGRPPFSGRVWDRAPSRQGDITHQSSHPPALHLLAPLPLPLRPPPLRSRWVHQPLPGIWGRNRQTDSSP